MNKNVKKNILISGASGLVGTALTSFFKENPNVQVVHLVRNEKEANAADSVFWKPREQEIDIESLEKISGEAGFDAVIHLSGANVAGKRWTEKYKQEILSSRVQSTKLIAETIQKLQTPPKVWISASAIGIYGFNGGNKTFDESSPVGDGFLAEVCKRWEAETHQIKEVGNTRVVNLRIGLVLSQHGGMLEKLLPLFRSYLGGPVGDGSQWMSWIGIEDLVRIIDQCVENHEVTGPVNAVTPNPVTNQQFTDALAQALGKPAKVRAPAFALKLALGKQMAEETALASQKAIPQKLIDAGFQWIQSNLEDCLNTLMMDK